MIFTAPAKVNLYLRVIRRRDDGYHDIETVFERVAIFDEVSIEPAADTAVSCNDVSIPTGKESIMGRAVSAFMQKSGAKDHFRIHVKKGIPVAAGLGGGSSDVASILAGLNQMTGAPLSPDDLLAIAKDLGADIPFFLSGASLACGKGRGDIISPLKTDVRMWHVIVNPPFGVSTGDVYGRVPAFNLTNEGSVDTMFSAFLSKKDIKGIAENLRNDLQIIVLRDFPALGQVFSALTEAGAKGVLLSGSGPTVFGIFDRENAPNAAKTISGIFKPEEGWRVFVAETY